VRHRRLFSVLAVLAGAALLVATLWAARPAQVIELARGISRAGLANGFLWATVVLLLRGLRLGLLSGDRLHPGRATAVIAAAQLPLTVLPLRLGELAFFPALRSAGVKGGMRGLGFLLLTRALDVGSLMVWAVGVGLWMRVPGLATAAVVAAVAGLVGYAVLRATRVARRVLLRLRRGRRWRQALIRQALGVRRELLRVAGTPWRAGAILGCSLAIWAGIWQLAVALLRGMGLAWPPDAVLLGTVGAAMGASLPLNAVGTFGTQEAGWAAALATVGVPAKEALAVGFASHSWSIVFAAAHCLAALPLLWLWHRRRARSGE
jgi:hypothetical protein